MSNETALMQAVLDQIRDEKAALKGSLPPQVFEGDAADAEWKRLQGSWHESYEVIEGGERWPNPNGGPVTKLHTWPVLRGMGILEHRVNRYIETMRGNQVNR